MTYETVINILETLKNSPLGIPYAYREFKSVEDIRGHSRYIAYFETGKNRFLADNVTYAWNPEFAIELYTKKKDLDAENALIDLFSENEVAWAGGDSTYIDSEKVYQTVFYI